MMGILADVANALGITIPQAGHLVSAYALGVTCGAPLLAVAKQFRPKSILLFLVCLIFIGALISSVAQSYEMLLVARFISGLPHGAYFGVASIVAVRLADEGHKTLLAIDDGGGAENRTPVHESPLIGISKLSRWICLGRFARSDTLAAS